MLPDQHVENKDVTSVEAGGQPGDHELELLRSILSDIKQGRMQLPSLPDVALRVRDAVSDANRSIGDIARIVQVDPALAARLVQVVNSPLYRGNKKIDNCHTAITRLGLVVTRNLVVSFTLRSLFKPREKSLAERMQATWRHSCRVGAISSVLARLTRGLDPDRAMLAGLTHDIGELPVLQYLERRREDYPPETVGPLLKRLRGPLGTFVLKTWQFDDDLAEVPKQVEDWFRETGEAIDYGDIIQVAHVHSQFGTPEAGRAPSLNDLPAFQKLPISKLGPDASLELLEQSQQEINEVIQILQA